MSTARFLPCPDCTGVRLHATRTVRSPDGKVTKVRECAGCQRRSPIPFGEHPGLACPRCGDCRLPAVYTRHRTLATVRVKRCRSCGHRVRTVERLESHAG